MNRLAILLLVPVCIYFPRNVFSQALTTQQIIGKWEVKDIQFQAKKSVWLNQFFSAEAMKNPPKFGNSELYHFRDESIVSKNDWQFFTYKIKSDDNNIPIIQMIPKGSDGFKLEEKIFEVASFSDNEMVLYSRERVSGTDLVNKLKFILPENEVIDQDEEIIKKISLYRVIEAPWIEVLNIQNELQGNMFQMERNKNQLLLWYNYSRLDDPFSSPNQYLVFYTSFDKGTTWEKKEIRLASDEYVNRFVLTNSGILLVTGNGLKFIEKDQTISSEIKTQKYPKEFTCCYRDAPIAAKGDSLVMMLEKSLWISLDAGRKWKKAEMENLNDYSLYTNVWFSPKGELLTEISSNNPHTGNFIKYLFIAPCFDKAKRMVSWPDKKLESKGQIDANADGYYYEQPQFSSFDQAGNLNISDRGNVYRTNDYGNSYEKYILPSCNQASENENQGNDAKEEFLNMMNNSSPKNLLFGKFHQICLTECGIWYKKNNTEEWVHAKHTDLSYLTNTDVFVFDDVIVAKGAGHILYSLKLND